MPGFNNSRFMKQKFEHRTEVIPVPALADWFDGDEKPEWIVRNLTTAEMVSAQEAVDKNKNIAAVIEALVASNQKDKIEAFKEIIGTSDNIPDELARRFERIVSGSVKPTIDMPTAIKLAKNFPAVFMTITNKIAVLTISGASKAKPKPSGKTIPPSKSV